MFGWLRRLLTGATEDTPETQKEKKQNPAGAFASQSALTPEPEAPPPSYLNLGLFGELDAEAKGLCSGLVTPFQRRGAPRYYEFRDYVGLYRADDTVPISLDGAILLLSSGIGITPQVKQHLCLIRLMEVPCLVVCLCLLGKTADGLELQIRELLSQYGFDTATVVQNTGRTEEEITASIDAIFQAVEAIVPAPERNNAPFLMWIEDYWVVRGKGIVAAGYVERGRIKINAPIELVGLDKDKRTILTSLEQGLKSTDTLFSGKSAGALLRGLGYGSNYREAKDHIERGQVLAEPGSIQAHTRFDGSLTRLDIDEEKRDTPILDGEVFTFLLRAAAIEGTIRFREGVEQVLPGETTAFTCELSRPVALEVGQRFLMRHGDLWIAAGKVTGLPGGVAG